MIFVVSSSQQRWVQLYTSFWRSRPFAVILGVCQGVSMWRSDFIQSFIMGNCSCVGLQCVICMHGNLHWVHWFVRERKLKKQSQKKLVSRPPFKFLVAKQKKLPKKLIGGGVSFAKMPVSQILKVCTVCAYSKSYIIL